MIQTHTGRMIDPLNPRAEDIDIKDIAHALSNICRFTGHCEEFYSVADHSLRVSNECPRIDALWGLLHDAPEAYLGDMASPTKHNAAMIAFREAEARLMDVICQRFGLLRQEPESVMRADRMLIRSEARDLMGNPQWCRDSGPMLHYTIRPCSSAVARGAFLRRFDELMRVAA